MVIEDLIEQLQAIYETHGNVNCLIQGGYARGIHQNSPTKLFYEEERFGSGRTVTIMSDY